MPAVVPDAVPFIPDFDMIAGVMLLYEELGIGDPTTGEPAPPVPPGQRLADLPPGVLAQWIGDTLDLEYPHEKR
jgi:hypothetical protein